MFNLKKLHNDESGITGFETALILIAFVVVASAFAFTILSTGTAMNPGLKNSRSSIEVKGSIIALDESASGTVGKVVFTVVLAPGNEPISLVSDSARKVVVIGYHDGKQFVNDLPWVAKWVGANNGNNFLEQGELAELTLDLSGLTNALGSNTAFTIEVKPLVGAVLNIQRTTPATIEAVVDLK